MGRTLLALGVATAGTLGIIGGAYAYNRLNFLAHHSYQRVVKVEEGDIVLDVGANDGTIFTIPAAKAAGPRGLVVSIEPDPENAENLARNVESAGLNNVVVVQAAACAQKGEAKLYLHEGSGQRSLLDASALPDHTRREYIVVRTDTLDSMVRGLGVQRVDFVKMDIEGGEIEALQGAEEVLKTARKLAIAAYHTNRKDISPTYPWVVEFLQNQGFCTAVTNAGLWCWPGMVHAWRPCY